MVAEYGMHAEWRAQARDGIGAGTRILHVAIHEIAGQSNQFRMQGHSLPHDQAQKVGRHVAADMEVAQLRDRQAVQALRQTGDGHADTLDHRLLRRSARPEAGDAVGGQPQHAPEKAAGPRTARVLYRGHLLRFASASSKARSSLRTRSHSGTSPSLSLRNSII